MNAASVDPELALLRAFGAAVRAEDHHAGNRIEQARFGLWSAMAQGDPAMATRWLDTLELAADTVRAVTSAAQRAAAARAIETIRRAIARAA